MTATPLSGPRIQASGYRKGRARNTADGKVWAIGIHTAEGATDETALGNFFHNNSNGSSHAGIGQDGGYASYVNYEDTAWAMPPLNDDSDNLEICGFAHWTRTEWLAQKAMLETVAKWIAWRCAVRSVPIRHVTSPTHLIGGVTGHVDVNSVYHVSNHWDPGPNFPWDTVLARANEIAAVPKPAPATKPVNAVEGGRYTVQAGDSYWKIAQAAYKNGNLWPIIAKANGNKALHPGDVITVPKRDQPAPPPVVHNDLGNWPGYGYVAVGKRNGYVQKLQAKLRRLGFANLNPSGATGYYGDETKAMVKAFQEKHRNTWPADGIAGPVTWSEVSKA